MEEHTNSDKRHWRDWLGNKVKGYKPRGFQGFSVYEIMKFIFSHFKNLRFFERAAAISFNFLMSIPPFLIFLLSLVPFLPLDNVQVIILDSIKILSPDEKLYRTAHNIIVDFMNTKRREILSIGFLLAIFYSSNGMQGIVRSFDMVHKIYVPRNGWKRRGRALILTLIMIVFIIAGIVLLFAQTNLMDKFLANLTSEVRLVKIVSFVLVVVLVYFAFCIIYYYAPSLMRRMKFFSVGALLASLSFIFFSYAFFFTVTHFVNYNRVYGPLGTLIMFMIWIYISAITILAGYEINATIMLHGLVKEKELDPDDLI